MTNRDSESKNTMGITNANKEISMARISCEETFNIKLSLTASPDIVSNPTDIVLLLDRSQSMAGSPLANLKNGVKKFIDIIADATGGGTQDGQIGAGSRIGIVSFSNTAVAEGNAAIFPDPVINIDCGEVLVTEPCPQPLDITIDGCEDSLVFDS